MLTVLNDHLEIKRIVDRIISGQADEYDYSILNQLLTDNYQNVQFYISCVDVHSGLRIDQLTLKPSQVSMYVQSDTKINQKSPFKWKQLAVVACIACYLVSVGYFFIPKHDPVATIELRRNDNPVNLPWTQESSVLRNTTYELDTGMITLHFARKTTVTIGAPCKFIPRGPLALELISGELSASIQDPDVQFKVLTKEHNIIDMGTAFGVKIDENHLTMHVFSGQVAVAPKEIEQSRMQVIKSGKAVDIDRQTLALTYLNQSMPEIFPTWQSQLTDLNIPSTGKGINPGEFDTNWQVQRLGSPEIKHPTVTDKIRSLFVPNDPESSQFDPKISQFVVAGVNADGTPSMNMSADSQAIDIYSCSFELQNADPETANILVKFIADDYLDKVLLNGHEVAIPELIQTNRRQFNTIEIKHHFKHGVNRIDFYVGNNNAGKLHKPGVELKPSAMSFRALLSGKVRYNDPPAANYKPEP